MTPELALVLNSMCFLFCYSSFSYHLLPACTIYNCMGTFFSSYQIANDHNDIGYLSWTGQTQRRLL